MKKQICFLVLIITLSVLPVAAADEISRGELAAIIAETLDLKLLPFEGVFQDVVQSDYGAAEIEAVYRTGYMSTDGVYFCPQKTVDRITLACIAANIYEDIVYKTYIPVYGTCYVDYKDLNREQGRALDIVTMMSIMPGISDTEFGNFEPAESAVAKAVIERIEYLRWRGLKLELVERIGTAAFKGASLEQKTDLMNEAREMTQIEAGGNISFDTSMLSVGIEEVKELLTIEPDSMLNIVGNAIAVRFNESSGFHEEITDVLIEGIPAEYTVQPGRILFTKNNFPVSGRYTICIKSSNLPDICFEQMIYGAEQIFSAE